MKIPSFYKLSNKFVIYASVSGGKKTENFSYEIVWRRKEGKICRYILSSLNHPSENPSHSSSCSFNGLKFILYLKRRRRAEEKLTNRIEGLKTKMKKKKKKEKKGVFREIILSDKWKIDDILWFWKIVCYLKIDFSYISDYSGWGNEI